MRVMFIPNDYRVDPFIATMGEDVVVVEQKPVYALCLRTGRVGSFVWLHGSRDDTPVEIPRR